jgi:hypothetical protein
MKFLILAVWLTVLQTSPPIPRQAPKSATGASKGVQNDASNKETKTNRPATTINTQAPEGDQPYTDKQRKEDAQYSVRIRELPPVTVPSPKKDWTDWGTWGFNLLLAVTSGFQAWLLCRTLNFVRRQTHEMKRQRATMGNQLKMMKGQLTEMERQTLHLESSVWAAQSSADAAMKNIHLIKAKERARLAIDFKPFRWKREIGESTRRFIEYEISIDGTTSATVLDTHLDTGSFYKEQMEEFNDRTVYITNPINNIPNRILPNTQPFRGYAIIDFGPDEASETAYLEGIKGEFRIIYVSGFIRYQDIFDQIWTVPFRRYWGRKDKRSILSSMLEWSDIEYGQWIPFGPPEENQEKTEES